MIVSLAKMSYITCPKEHKRWYDTVPVGVSRYDIRPCCVDLAHSHDGSEAGEVCTAAATHGHTECLLMARSRGLDWDEKTTVAAASAGHVELLRYLCDNGCPLGADAPVAAAAGGHAHVLGYLWARGRELDDEVMTAAARHGRVECMRFCREVAGMPWTPQTMLAAASHGRVESMRYAYANGYPRDSSPCVVAAMNGHLNCLEYAHYQGCRLAWPVYTMASNAACREWSMEHLRMDKGEDQSVVACNSVAAFGTLEDLKFLRSVGFPWDESTWNIAFTRYRWDILTYMIKHGCPRPGVSS